MGLFHQPFPTHAGRKANPPYTAMVNLLNMGIMGIRGSPPPFSDMLFNSPMIPNDFFSGMSVKAFNNKPSRKIRGKRHLRNEANATLDG